MKSEPHGVRGWLLLLCIALIYLAPLARLMEALATLSTLSTMAPGDKQGLALVDLAAGVFFIAFSITAGVKLRRARPGADRVAKVFLAFNFAYALVAWPAVLRIYDVELSDLDFGDPDVLRGFVPLVSSAIWYAYLARSRRVRNTYGPPANTVEWLAATRSLTDAVRRGGRRLPWWAGAGFFMGVLLASLLFAWSWAVVWIVCGGVPLSFVFIVLLSRRWRAWQSVLVWGLAGALAGMARRAIVLFLAESGLGFEYVSEAMIPLFEPLNPKLILIGFLFEALFLAGLLLAARLWGVRLWSLAAGSLAGTLAADVLIRIAQGYASVGSHDLIQAFSALLSGAFIYAGLLLHADRSFAGETAVGP